MRFKIGDTWHETEPGKHLMIEFENDDKLAISMMPEGTTRFASFNFGKEKWPKEKCLAWMNDGARIQAEKSYTIKRPKPGWVSDK